MPIICQFPGGGGSSVETPEIPNYGGVAGTGVATFLNFPMTVSNNKPNADGEREGAIWIQTKNLLGEATKISIQDTIPDANSEDDVLYFVLPNMKQIKMDVIQETGVWKPIEMHIISGSQHPWLVGSLDDGSKIYLNLPKMYSKIGGKINIENAWYWHDDAWQIVSEVGRPFFKASLGINLIGSGMKTSYYLKTLPPGATSGANYFVSSTGEYIVVTNHIIRGNALGASATNDSYYSEENSTFQIYKLDGLEYTPVSEAIALSSIDGLVPDNSSATSSNINSHMRIYFFNVVCNADASIFAIYYLSKAFGTSVKYNFIFSILEKDGDSWNIIKTKAMNSNLYTTNNYGLQYNTSVNTSVDASFSLFSFFKVWAKEYATSPSFYAVYDHIYYDGNEIIMMDVEGINNHRLISISRTISGNILGFKVLDEHLLCGVFLASNGSIRKGFILVDDGDVIDVCDSLSDYINIETISYERIGNYGVATYTLNINGAAENYIMGLSYNRETMEFVSTNVQVRTYDQITNPVDEGFEHPDREYLSHYSIKDDEALFTIKGVTLLKGGGANFDTETGVITPATTMMDQGVKVYEDTVSRTGGPNVYIGD